MSQVPENIVFKAIEMAVETSRVFGKWEGYIAGKNTIESWEYSSKLQIDSTEWKTISYRIENAIEEANPTKACCGG